MNNIKQRKRVYNKQYYSKEENIEKRKQWELKNKKKIRQRGIQYRLENKERIKQWFLQNKEKVKKRKKQYRLDNIERLKLESKLRYSKEGNRNKKQYYLKNRKKIVQYRLEETKKLSDSVVKNYLARKSNLKPLDIPQGLMESKRLQLKIYRFLNEEKKELKTIGAKRCYSCKKIKLIEEFNKREKAKDSKNPYCRYCEKKKREEVNQSITITNF